MQQYRSIVVDLKAVFVAKRQNRTFSQPANPFNAMLVTVIIRKVLDSAKCQAAGGTVQQKKAVIVVDRMEQDG